VTASAFTLARVRLWRWLAVTALVFGVLWTIPGHRRLPRGLAHPTRFHVVAVRPAPPLLIVSGFLFGPDATAGEIDSGVVGGARRLSPGVALFVVAAGIDPLALMTYVALVAATIGFRGALRPNGRGAGGGAADHVGIRPMGARAQPPNAHPALEPTAGCGAGTGARPVRLAP